MNYSGHAVRYNLVHNELCREREEKGKKTIRKTKLNWKSIASLYDSFKIATFFWLIKCLPNKLFIESPIFNCFCPKKVGLEHACFDREFHFRCKNFRTNQNNHQHYSKHFMTKCDDFCACTQNINSNYFQYYLLSMILFFSRTRFTYSFVNK